MTIDDYLRRLARLSVDFAILIARSNEVHPEVWPMEHDEETWNRMFASFLGVIPEARR